MEEENVPAPETAPAEETPAEQTPEEETAIDTPSKSESQDGPVDEEVPVPGTRPTDSEFAHRDSEGALIVNPD